MFNYISVLKSNNKTVQFNQNSIFVYLIFLMLFKAVHQISSIPASNSVGINCKTSLLCEVLYKAKHTLQDYKFVA